MNLRAVFGTLDWETQEHSQRVAVLAGRLVAHARDMNVPIADKLIKSKVVTAALLHDIGKTVIPHSLLRKARRLTPPEERLMRHHPQFGRSLAAALGADRDLKAAIGQHHERWDGAGYPDGVTGRNICPAARLIAVADAFDAITSRRSYSAEKSEAAALDILCMGAGTQWDPQAVEVLVCMLTGSSVALPTPGDGT